MFELTHGAIEESVRQVEETATLRAQIERYQRLSTTRELEGDLAQSGAFDAAAARLGLALDAVERAHEVAGVCCEC